MQDLLSTAIEMHQAGQLGAAAQMYLKVLAKEATNAAAMRNPRVPTSSLSMPRVAPCRFSSNAFMCSPSSSLRPTM